MFDGRGNVAEASVSIKISAPVWQSGAKYVGVGFGWVLVVILVVMALIIPLTLLQNFKGKIQGKYLLEIENRGNVISRYDLQLISEPTGILKANFSQAGQPLPLHKMVEPAPEATAAQPAKKGFFNRRKDERSEAEKTAAAEKRNSALSVFGVIWDAGTEILRSLTLIVGGPVGNALRTVSTQATRAEYVASTTQRIGHQANRVGETVGGGNQGSNQESGSQDSYTDTYSGRPSTPPPPKVKVLPGEWAQTTEISAGEKVTLELLVTPLKTNNTQTYTFRILSRATATPDLDPSFERTTVEIPGLAWWQSTLPWVVTLLLLGAAVITSLFLLSQVT